MIEKRLRQVRRSHCSSVRIDEICVEIRGKWRYRSLLRDGAAIAGEPESRDWPCFQLRKLSFRQAWLPLSSRPFWSPLLSAAGSRSLSKPSQEP